MPAESCQVTVVVVTYNSADVIEGLLDSLPAAAPADALDVVVVDNGSSDNTVAIVEGYPSVTLVRSHNDGYAAGINRGVRASSGSGPVLVLNPDVRLGQDCVGELREGLGWPGAGIVVPRLLDEDGNLRLSLRRDISVLRIAGLNWTHIPAFSEAYTEPEMYDRPVAVPWAEGSVMMISRECLERVGSWDESYFLYSEETDFSLRARDAGFLTYYQPDAEAVHIGGASGRSARTFVYRAINAVRLYRRRKGPVPAGVFWGVSLMRELRHGLRYRDFSVAKAMVRPQSRPLELQASQFLLPR